MIVTHNKEKAYNAIIFFTKNTAMCNKKKLYKLLWLLDSEHFELIGRSVTGYEYAAWPMGPVPVELHNAIENESPELIEAFNIYTQTGKRDYDSTALISKHEFERKYFSRAEFELMVSLADRFDLMNGTEMEAFTHRQGTPWYRVWHTEGNRQAIIPYEYALDHMKDEERQVILEISEEGEAFLANYK